MILAAEFNHQIVLIACLVETPKIEMDKHGGYKLQLHIEWLKTAFFSINSVIITEQSALCIRQYTKPGQYLWMVGKKYKSQFIAYEIKFIDLTPTSANDQPDIMI